MGLCARWSSRVTAVHFLAMRARTSRSTARFARPPDASRRAARPLACRYTLKKVVGGPEEYSAKGLTVKAHAFTESARAAIEGSGGTCVVLPKTAPAEAPAEAAA